MTQPVKTRTCSSCGKNINADATFCIYCFGKNESAEGRRYRVCPHCGKEISVKATRCKHCLAEVTATSPAPIPSSGTGINGSEATREQLAQPPITPIGVSTAASTVEYRYQVVPFIGTMKSGLFSSDNAQTVSVQLQNLINHHTQQGWEFYSLEKVNIQVSPGCIGQMLGQSASYITFDQVIFRQRTRSRST